MIEMSWRHTTVLEWGHEKSEKGQMNARVWVGVAVMSSIISKPLC